MKLKKLLNSRLMRFLFFNEASLFQFCLIHHILKKQVNGYIELQMMRILMVA